MLLICSSAPSRCRSPQAHKVPNRWHLLVQVRDGSPASWHCSASQGCCRCSLCCHPCLSHEVLDIRPSCVPLFHSGCICLQTCSCHPSCSGLSSPILKKLHHHSLCPLMAGTNSPSFYVHTCHSCRKSHRTLGSSCWECFQLFLRLCPWTAS